ncbi:MAG: hypothetical protein IT316_09875 [Anaerolineales bacterium]|nr:hypothetical protein [Anaerolineales bacterium]
MKVSGILPVMISILVIITVAVVQKQSKLIAAVTATMPVTIPLSLWIVYAGAGGNPLAMQEFTRGMLNGIIPTVAFVVAIWLGARVGMKLTALIILGYAAWAVTLAGLLLARRFLSG